MTCAIVGQSNPGVVSHQLKTEMPRVKEGEGREKRERGDNEIQR